jgi:L-rhamnose-H+ transport protein
MNALLGVIFHFIGGFASGSFYLPYKKVKGWAWESYWIVGGIFSWLIVPFVAAYLTVPDFMAIIKAADSSTIMWTYIMGLLWGIGGLTYGLGVRYLGVSLGSSIILGLCAVFGALIPSIYYDIFPEEGHTTITQILHSTWGQTVLFGLAICILGIIICGRAGILKDKDLNKTGTAKAANDEFQIIKGLIIAVVSGVLSACFSFGIESGKPMAAVANTLWASTHVDQGNFLYGNNVTYIIIMWGGLTTNFIWCMMLNMRNKTFGDYTNDKTPLLKNYMFSALAGTTWFLQFFFYGMGESKLNNGASSWILHMAFIILIANAWGLILKEWKGVSKKTLITIFTGIAVIIISVLIVGYGNSLK